MDREIDTSMITEEQMIQIRRNAEEDMKLEEMTKARRKQASKRRGQKGRAYRPGGWRNRSVAAEVAEACGLIKYRHPDTGKICWE